MATAEYVWSDPLYRAPAHRTDYDREL